MNQSCLSGIIAAQTDRALREIGNLLKCIPEASWESVFGGQPVWRHVYHMLHSLDLWFMNPRNTAYDEPSFHINGMNSLIHEYQGPALGSSQLTDYFSSIHIKITNYTKTLKDDELLHCPDDCEYTRFTLILAQFRHVHTHMGMLMGFVVSTTNKWPYIIGLEGEEKQTPDGQFYS